MADFTSILEMVMASFLHKEYYQAREYQLRRKMCVYEHKPVTVLTGHTDHMTFEIKLRSGLMRMER